jgi:hypothetical protein
VKSILDLLSTIASIPFIEARTRRRASKLRYLMGARDLDTIFGAI